VKGVVERRRGVGTFISAPKIEFNKLMSYVPGDHFSCAGKILHAPSPQHHEFKADTMIYGTCCLAVSPLKSGSYKSANSRTTDKNAWCWK
jgi:hypothetical protein